MYNTANSILTCMDSILKLHLDYEVILVDDGSTDNTEKLINENYYNNTRIRYFKKVNGGVASARNYGLKFAQGKYVTFVDADDMIEPTHFTLFFEQTTNEHLDWAASDYYIGKINTKINLINSVGFYRVSTIHCWEDVLMHYEIGYVWGKLYRKELLDSSGILFDESLTFAEDKLFNICYAIHAKKIAYYSIKSYIYILSDGSLSRRYCPDLDSNIRKINENYFKLFESRPEYEKKYKQKNIGIELECVLNKLRNVFRVGNNFSGLERYNEVNKIIQEFIRNDLAHRRQTITRFPDKLMYVSLRTHSPTIVYIVSKVRHLIKG